MAIKQIRTMIAFEKEVVQYLGLPSIPRKTWNGKSAFDKGVALVEINEGMCAYAVCSFNPVKGDKTPKLTKVFGLQPMRKIKEIYVVPDYMTNEEDIKTMDLDEESKKRATLLLNEAKELENEGIEETSDTVSMDKLPEWIFDEIHSLNEAKAWLKNYQSRNRQKGRIPTTEENIKLRLYSIYTELNKKTK